MDDLRRATWEPLLQIIQSERTRWAATWQDLDLTPAQGFMLLKLARLGPGPMSALAEAMQCDASNITGLVDKLEARGFLARGADAQDRRVKVLSTTAAGAAACEEIENRIRVPPECFSGLSRDDLVAIRTALTKAADLATSAPLALGAGLFPKPAAERRAAVRRILDPSAPPRSTAS